MGRKDSFETVPFPRMRRVVMDSLRMARRKHVIHALIEVDVTEPRRIIRRNKSETGETLSFTAFVISCVGRAVGADRILHAYRNWRNQLVIFDEVDVLTWIEVDLGDWKMPMPHIIRAANEKSFREIHDDIRAAQARQETSEGSKLAAFAKLPTFVRRGIYYAVDKNPRLVKKYKGTVGLTSVGMFGRGSGWGLRLTSHTLGVTLGGIAEKPGVVEGRVVVREYLNLTIDFDHDIVDGAPAARFTQHLKDLIESGHGLPYSQSLSDK